MTIMPTPSPEVLMHQLLGAFFLPPLLFFWLLPLAWLAYRRGKTQLGRMFLALCLLLIYLFSTPRTAIWLSRPLEPKGAISADELARVDAIVVLGGGKRPAPEYGGESLSYDSYARVRYGAWLAKQTHKPLLLTGGAPLGGEAEAVIMARVLQGEFGITPRWVESASNTTLENARLSVPMLHAAGVHSIALVTQAWHMRRAERFFHAEGLTVYPAATGFNRYEGPVWTMWLPQGRAMQECHSALREDVGIAFYALRDWFKQMR